MKTARLVLLLVLALSLVLSKVIARSHHWRSLPHRQRQREHHLRHQQDSKASSSSFLSPRPAALRKREARASFSSGQLAYSPSLPLLGAANMVGGFVKPDQCKQR